MLLITQDEIGNTRNFDERQQSFWVASRHPAQPKFPMIQQRSDHAGWGCDDSS